MVDTPAIVVKTYARKNGTWRGVANHKAKDGARYTITRWGRNEPEAADRARKELIVLLHAVGRIPVETSHSDESA